MLEIFKSLENVENYQGNISKINTMKNLLKNSSKAVEFIKIVYNKNMYKISDKIIEKSLDYNKEKKYINASEMAKDLSNGKESITLEQVYKMCDDVEKLSGNDLSEYIKDLFSTFDKISCKFITKIFLHNLHNGISFNTINKILDSIGEEMIEKFSPQLCSSIKENQFNKVKFPCIVDVKYDGLRIVAFKKREEVTLKTRDDKIANSYLPEVVNSLKNIPFDFVLDGEVIAKDFSTIQSRIGRKIENLELVEGLQYIVFDILEYCDEDIKKYSQNRRHNLLFSLKEDLKNITICERKFINNIEDLQTEYNWICKRGEEGIIIKELSKPYEYDSRKNWFKVKPFKENTFKIIGYKYGTGKYKDTVGSILVQSGEITCDVGSGLKDYDRSFFKEKMLNDNQNIFVDIKYQEITKNKNGTCKLRFPSFIKVRVDKTEEDKIKIPS
jgi:ATP-dependent DNA ligase